MKIAINQIPYDSGHYNKRMGTGPVHLIENGLVENLLATGHEVKLNQLKLEKEFVTEVGAVLEVQHKLSRQIAEDRNSGYFPVTLSGNCNYSAFGNLSGKNRTGVIWFDAHGDFNTPETTPSGFFDGTCLNAIVGNSWKAVVNNMNDFTPVPEENVIFIGARDLDEAEAELIENSKCETVSVDELSGSKLNEQLDLLKNRVDDLYIHIDMDVLDVNEFKANHYAVPNGLTVEQLNEVVKLAKEKIKISGIGFASFDAAYDTDNKAVKIVEEVINQID